MSAKILFPPQEAVIEHGMLDLGFSAVLSLPTGSGKTTIAEMGMERALASGERVAYLTPLKALAEEKVAAWKNRWGSYKVGIFTGDYESSAAPISYKNAEVLICTYERLDGALRYWQQNLHWLSKLGLVVVDELHLLMDPSRGPRLEGTISRLRRVNPFCRVMGMSATISNHTDIAAWLDGVSYHSSWRPVPLEHEIRRYKRLTDKPTLVAEIVAETADNGGQTLVFSSSRRRAEQLASQISVSGYPASHHHAGLGLARRREIESDFRTGKLACLVATPTLEMGLNLPCRTVVIADNTRWNGETFAPLPIWNYLQRAGRAGRPGQDGIGRAILLAPTWARNLADYGNATPEPIQSQLIRTNNMMEQVLIEISSRSCRTPEQLVGTFLPSTLAYQQNPSITKDFETYLVSLISAGLIKEDDNHTLNPTKAGWITVRHQLSPATAKHLIGLKTLSDTQPLTDFDLILYHCWDQDLQPKLPLSIEVVEALEELIHSIPSYLLDTSPPASLTPRLCAGGVLMATLTWHFIQGDDLQGICEHLDVYAFDAELLKQSLVRLLKASADLHVAIDPEYDPEKLRQHEQIYGHSLVTKLRCLALKLEYGLPGDSVDLTYLPGCGGKLARRLLDTGIRDLEDLCNEELSELAAIPGIGPKRASTWIKAAEFLIKEMVPDNTESKPSQQRSMTIPNDWPHDIEPGRLQRSTALKVESKQNTYWVSGGAEEHCITGDVCDCGDFVKHGPDWWCKHRLAVRLANKDRDLQALVSRLDLLTRPATLAGHLAELALGKRWKNA